MIRVTAPILIGLALFGCSDQQSPDGEARHSDLAAPEVRMVPWTELRDARDTLDECRKAFAESTRNTERALRGHREIREIVFSRISGMNPSSIKEQIDFLKHEEEVNERYISDLHQAYKDVHPNCFK